MYLVALNKRVFLNYIYQMQSYMPAKRCSCKACSAILRKSGVGNGNHHWHRGTKPCSKAYEGFFFYKPFFRRGDRLHSDIADQSSNDTPTEKHNLILKELREWSKKCGKAVFL